MLKGNSSSGADLQKEQLIINLVRRQILSDVRKHMYSWAEMKDLIGGQGLGGTGLEIGDKIIRRKCMQMYCCIALLCLNALSSLHCRGGTQQPD